MKDISTQFKVPYLSVKAWFDKKEKLSKPSKMDKFTESTWRFTFYLSIFLYGVFALKNVKFSLQKLNNYYKFFNRNHGHGIRLNVGMVFHV